MVVWGINPVLEALEENPEGLERIIIFKKALSGKVYRILELAKKHEIQVKIVDDPNFHPPKVLPQANTQGVVAYISEFQYASLEDIEMSWTLSQETPLVLALDGIVDPQNLGSIIRSAVALFAHGIFIPKHRACEVTGTVIKASSGAAFKIPIAKVTNLKHALSYFKKLGVYVLGLTHKTETNIFDLDLCLPLNIIAGSEGSGIRPSLLKECDFLAKIPISPRMESLNVAQAIAIALYEVQRQRCFAK
jgi:rRNA methylase, putative, group 3